jgi:hypothetical protein
MVLPEGQHVAEKVFPQPGGHGRLFREAQTLQGALAGLMGSVGKVCVHPGDDGKLVDVWQGKTHSYVQ